MTAEGSRLDSKPGTVSGQTALNAYRVLHRALEVAVKLQLVHRNVAAAVEPPKPERYQPEVIPHSEQISHLLQAAEGHWIQPILYLALHTGLRRGELSGLKWQDVDLEAGEIYITRALQRQRRKGLVAREPKTEKARRSIALAPSVVSMMHHLKIEQAKARSELGPVWQGHDLVFCRPDGRPVDPHELSRTFRALADRVGFPRLRLHDLRHTHATLLFLEDIHPKTVQERMGHTTISITLDIYSHVVPGMQQAAAGPCIFSGGHFMWEDGSRGMWGTTTRGGSMASQGFEVLVHACLLQIESERARLRTLLVPMPGSRILEPDRSSEFLQTVKERIEKTQEFEKLVTAVTTAVGGDIDTPNTLVASAVSNLLALSGAYHEEHPTSDRFVSGITLNLEEHLAPHCRSKITHLYSLPWLDIGHPLEPLDIGRFRIRQFTVDEMGRVIGNHIRCSFFPYSAIDLETLERLSLEPWLIGEDEEEVVPPGSVILDLSDIGGKVTHTDLPPNIEYAFGRLMLLRWELASGWHSEDEDRWWWPGFFGSTLIRLSDNLFQTPERPFIGDPAYTIDRETGSISRQLPGFSCRELAVLADIDNRLNDLEQHNETAFLPTTVLPFLVRAALTSASPATKREQVLSFVTAIEALVGSKGSGVTERIMRRLGVLLNRRNIDHVAGQFREIWEMRNRLVHGQPVEEVDPRLSWRAWRMATSATRSALNVLHAYVKARQPIDKEEFGWLLDSLASGKKPHELRQLLELWEDVTIT